MSAVFEIALASGSSGEPGINAPAPAESQDHELIRYLQADDELAYRGFVERYKTRIFRVTYGILRNYAEAEEITQEVFVKVFRSIRSFTGRSSLFTWVHRIAVNECYSALRRRKLTVSLDTSSPDNTGSTVLQSRPDPSPSCDAVVLHREYLNQLLQAIPEEDRHLLMLRGVEGLSMAELAEATGRSEKSVKTRLFRARRRLANAAAKLQSRPPFRRDRQDEHA
jgi:RNA polymerase sigma-70 factor (ECF subfamily)